MNTDNLIDRLLEGDDITSNGPKLTNHLNLAFSELQKAKTQIHALSDKIERLKRDVPEFSKISQESVDKAEDFAASISFYMREMENSVKMISRGVFY